MATELMPMLMLLMMLMLMLMLVHMLMLVLMLMRCFCQLMNACFPAQPAADSLLYTTITDPIRLVSSNSTVTPSNDGARSPIPLFSRWRRQSNPEN